MQNDSDKNSHYAAERAAKESRKRAEREEAPNLQDAKDLGYTDREGHAISRARHDKQGHPTGAYTDIGAGRSSAVRTEGEVDTTNSQELSREQNPAQGSED